MPDFFEVLRDRRTVRAYREEPVSDKDLQELIDLAILAPTGMNSQPWAFTVITDRKVMEQINVRIKEILRAPGLAEMMRMEGLQAALKSDTYSIFYHAPALIAIHGKKGAVTAQIDCQLAAENLFLAAQAKGLGTCYIGFLFFGLQNPQVRSLLRIPDGYDFMAAAIVGHPSQQPSGPPKREPAKIEWVRAG